jgi:hypothetical protein
MVPSVTFDSDIVFNRSETWCGGTPSGCTWTDVTHTYSIGQTAMHEFGHYLGLNHEDDNIATMNDGYPGGGDMAQTHFRINEDDYAGLVDRKATANAGTGNNLMLSRFSYWSVKAFERWDNEEPEGESDDTKTWDRSDDDWFPAGDASHPGKILAVFEGTSGTLSGVDVEWRVRQLSDPTCFDSNGWTEYTVGHRSFDVSVNVPYSIGPDDWDLWGVPTGTYILCAKIDPYSEFTETWEGDNVVFSEAYVLVRI